MKKMLLGLALAGAVAVGAAEYRFELEKCQDNEGWKVDSCAAWNLSKGLMLDAVGTKGAKADATLTIPEDGTYYAWFRVISFGQSSRKVQVNLDGKKIGIFGEKKIPKDGKAPMMLWQKARKPLELKKGDVVFSFTSLNGYVRADVMILSTDKEFVPSDDKAEIEAIEEIEYAE